MDNSSKRELSSSSRTASEHTKFKLTMDTINPYVKNMEYAVRGKMPQEAAKIEADIRKVSLAFGYVGLCRLNS